MSERWLAPLVLVIVAFALSSFALGNVTKHCPTPRPITVSGGIAGPAGGVGQVTK